MNLKVIFAKTWNVPSRWGEKLGWNWLVYNPGVFLEFALVARRNAPMFASSLVEIFPGAKRWCDIGAGTGQFVQAFRRMGMQADGFEYSATGRAFARVQGIGLGRFDLAATVPLDLHGKYDVVFSLEVGEHIPEPLSRGFVRVLTSAAPVVVVTCAGPGQPGHGHINCQPKEFWTGIFENEGYREDSESLGKLISKLRTHKRLSPFLIDNLMVFKATAREAVQH